MYGQKQRKNKTDFGNILATQHYFWAVENLLKLLADTLDAELSGNDNLDHIWKKVNEKHVNKFGNPLSSKNEIFKLRRDRNAAQHTGTAVGNPDCLINESYTQKFLEVIFREVYKKSLHDLSMSMVITNRGNRKNLIKAESLIRNSLYKDAIRVLYEIFLQEFERIRSTIIDQDLYNILPYKYSRFENKEVEKVYSEVTHLVITVVILQDLKIRLLDYSRFVRLGRASRTYSLDKLMNGEDSETSGFSKDDAEFCHDFLTNLLLKWEQNY